MSDGQILTATEGHPFKTADGWRDAIMLKKGGKLLLKGGDGDGHAGRTATIAEIRTEQRTLPVFNLEVANGHTYFVGIDGELVHNANCTRLGIARKNASDWRKLRNVWDDAGYGDILSDANRKAISKGRTPKVDEEWIKAFPEDAGLKGERIPMHHIQGSPITVPLPETRHLDEHMPGGFRYNPGGPGSSIPFYR